MFLRNRFLFSALLLATALPYAVGQSIQVGAPKVLQAIAPWTGTTDEVRDVATDDLGNRYAVGTIVDGTNINSFVTKTNRAGVHQWTRVIDLSAGDYARAVVADTPNNAVYVGLSVNGTETLHRYDPAGNLVWSASNVSGSIHDLAIDLNGNIVSAGQEVDGTTRYSALLLWNSDGTGYSGSRARYTGGGIFANILIDETGRIFAVGYNDDRAGVKADTLCVEVTPDWSESSGWIYGGGDNTWSDRSQTLARDSNGMVVFGGYSHNASTGEIQGFLGTADFDATENAAFYTRFADTGGSSITDVLTDPTGNTYFAGTSDFASGNPFGFMLAETKDPAEAWFIDAWYDEFESVTAGEGLQTYNMALLPGNRVALGCLDGSDVVTGAGTYRAYNLFTWAADGTRLQRTVLGSVNAPIPSTFDPLYMARFVNNVLYSHGNWSMYAESQGSSSLVATLWNGLFREGPDDEYMGKEDLGLIIGSSQSILKNDPNGWDLVYPNKARLVAGSASDGFNTLLVRQNGTVEASFDPNYNGDATFQYEVLRNNVVVDTNTVTIHVAAVPDAPVAVDDSYTIAMNASTVNLTVLDNDFDVDGEAILILSKTNPSSGTLTKAADSKSLNFKPAAGFVGKVTFTYTIKDPTGRKDTATVSVTVQ